jgi:protein gp37
MAEQTAIGWCHSTFNPWMGCSKISPGCDHCYAEALMDKRWHRVQWGPGQARKRTSEATWKQPLLWEREHEAFMLAHGRRRRVFCASLADVFDLEAEDVWRAQLLRLIRQTPNLDWLLLTKRIGNANALIMKANADLYLAGEGDGRSLPGNVWLGITVVNQQEADRDIPKLLQVPAVVRFLSVEPMLGPVNLISIRRSDGWNIDALSGVYSRHHDEGFDHPSALEEHGGGPRLDWVIAGGESGPGARPAHADWFHSMRDQCAAAGVPFYLKQVTENGRRVPIDEWPADMRIQESPEVRNEQTS